uniref:Nucleolus and neural progenitor protein n=1 Tax=Poecilia latipinna TaxID=48699 RepID=A0A3B3VX26_9TELE
MAEEQLWNRVNIPYPCATSVVRIKVAPETVKLFKDLLLQNDEVLKLLHSKLLQTEIRLLYDLMHILNNSYRGNKTFKGLQQVEQCVNRLKTMKLDAALQGLIELCPNQIQMALCSKKGDCDVPSQPMLEWTCLKVLGAGKLLSCTLSRCTKRQMKWEEFLILNIVLTSMLSRLWVFFRGLLVSLCNLYQWLLELLKAVAQAKPMPFLTDTVLPADMAEFLGPSDALVLKNEQTDFFCATKFISSIKYYQVFICPYLPYCLILISKGKTVSKLSNKVKKQEFKKQVSEATTFALLAANLEEIIQWCGSERMKRTKRLLTFLHIKCQQMKCLEAEGHKTFRFTAVTKRITGRRSHSVSLWKRFMLSRARTSFKRTVLLGQQKDSGPVVYFKDVGKSKASNRRALQINNPDSNEDIDDIFATAGL